jgi:hypothetical protein
MIILRMWLLSSSVEMDVALNIMNNFTQKTEVILSLKINKS